MNTQDFITKLQKQPYHTRVKILWGTVGIVALVLFVLWVLSLKSTIKNLDAGSLIKTAGVSIEGTRVSYAEVERVEDSPSSLKIYFNFNNPSDDILNIPTLNNITLTVKGKSVSPTQITDRQGRAFAQKILSRQQNFGILVFPKIDAGSGTLAFKQMSFERSPEQILSQTIELDLKKLQTTDKLRD